MNSQPCQEPPKGEEVTEKEIKIAVAKDIEVLLSTHMPSFQNLSK
ncbi:MAG TPA: hypothetical protein VFD60_12270 [Nitrososphaeraceae archaeon]|jgi:hypothetical protein|nr:hypothetical protein [Nitrososphaeraceae archaeon]